MTRLLQVIVLLIWTTLITELLLKFWVLKLEAASREAEAQRKYDELQLQLKTEAAAREAEATRKYDKLQLQLQNMMKMFQQS
ncbi:hypothetical protein Gotur_005920 [Gossypium turneri]